MYLKKDLLLLLVVLALLTPIRASAEEQSTSTDPGRVRSDLKATIAKTREDYKMRLEEMRKEASESMKQKRDLLQLRLQTIRDAKKSERILKINDKMTDVNKRRTEHLENVLVRLNLILDRIAQRAETAKGDGKDTSAVEQAITDARTSIESAQTAVASQSAKVYTLEVADEATIKTTVGKVVSELQSDLRSVHALVVAAKQKVSAVIREAARAGIGKIGKKEKEASASPTLKPTAAP